MHTEMASTSQESSAIDTVNSSELAQLRLALAEQTEHLDQLMARITHLVQRESELRAALVAVHRQLADRDSELRIQHLRVEELNRERNKLRAAVDEAMIIIELCDEVTRERQKKSKKK
jgi:hypothetical protein